ncbi:alpha-L-rhamnosidase [Flammeovirgaceae bacterium 311]|nr:alpha-L-rhamnosidase [Flammeovirgaceae bacterium 311]
MPETQTYQNITEGIMNLKFYTLIVLLTCSLQLQAMVDWQAQWISFPNLNPDSYAVLHFRNSFELSEIPARLPLLISADIRYKLYINGKYLGQGPANNDQRHYVYDEHDIATSLRKGKNTIAVTVFSLAEMTPLRYETSGAKLIVQASNDALSKVLNTGSGNWRVKLNEAYSPTRRGREFEVISYFAMGGGEKIKADQYPWGWKEQGFDDAGWPVAMAIAKGANYGHKYEYGAADLSLQARSIPFMDESFEQRPVMRNTPGPLTKGFVTAWQKNKPLTIPANTEATLLLDQTYLTKGHPYYTFSGGRNAVVKVGYAETLFVDVEEHQQGHRDVVDGKEFIGLSDIYLLDGGKDREFSTLIPRVWRYIQVKVKTADEPLSWNSYQATKFIYPFRENASFASNLPVHKSIWNVGWRTARLCADETYMDCPYYEQLQYVGDTRIQALISLYVSGDDRLMKNAINQFANSITDEGITQSRFPSSSLQYIPPYSLFWVNMVHDYHMHRKDDAFTAQYLHQITSVLLWFETRLREDKLLGPMPWWSYVDVVDGWTKASPPGSWEGGSLMLTLQYVYALQDAIALLEHHQKDALAKYFSDLKNSIQQAVVAKGYNADSRLFADTPDQASYSQHTNIMAILTDTAPINQQAAIFEKITTDPSVARTNIYFSFYLHRAAQKTGNGAYFLNNLDIWKKMLKQGLTTFSETMQQTRSDCHAWSASPNYEFLNLVCGIQPASAHFESIRIEPNPGSLRKLSGKMPHPKGSIGVDFSFDKNSVAGEIVIPENTQATFYWKGKEVPLVQGKNSIKISNSLP